MINPTEIRIGNYIYYFKDIIEVVEINHPNSQYYIKGYKAPTIYYNEVAAFEPIPLNEEWLDKFTFNDSEYKTGYIGKDFHDSPPILDFVLTKPEFMGEWQTYYAFELSNNRFVPVKYVHRLQNLFYEITNEELTIKK